MRKYVIADGGQSDSPQIERQATRVVSRNQSVFSAKETVRINSTVGTIEKSLDERCLTRAQHLVRDTRGKLPKIDVGTRPDE